MKLKSLSRTNVHLRSSDALFLHARNVATSTAVETGKPVDEYTIRCLSRLKGEETATVIRPGRNPPPKESRGN